jgi:hypothetical protein
VTRKDICRAVLIPCRPFPQRQPDSVPFAYILPSADLDLAKKSFASFFDYAQAAPEIDLRVTFVEKSSWYEMWSGRECFLAFFPLPSLSPHRVVAHIDVGARQRSTKLSPTSMRSVSISSSAAVLSPRASSRRARTRSLTFSLRHTAPPSFTSVTSRSPSLLPTRRLICSGSQSPEEPFRTTPRSLRASTLAGEQLFCNPPSSPSRSPHSMPSSVRRHIDLPVSWSNSSSPSQIQALEQYLTNHTLALGKIASAGGHPESSYASESDFNERDWQNVWYGKENYACVIYPSLWSLACEGG